MGKSKYANRKPIKEQKNKLIIVCSGQTEKIYLEYLKKEFGYRDIDIVPANHSQPRKVIDVAIKKKTDNSIVWVVFDKDDDEAHDFDDQIERANKRNIHCAFSNLSIEYWLYLHFQKGAGSFTQTTLVNAISKHTRIVHDKTEKNTNAICSKLINDIAIENAIKNAKQGHQKHALEYPDNPVKWWSCSTVYLLIEKMKEWSDSLK
jgi:hypothetical protein